MAKNPRLLQDKAPEPEAVESTELEEQIAESTTAEPEEIVREEAVEKRHELQPDYLENSEIFDIVEADDKVTFITVAGKKIRVDK